MPVRKRGRHTRGRLLAAAGRVFERDGFLSARVADIAVAAGVAHGSFYTYFDSKEDVFREVVREVIDAVYASLDVESEGSTADRIRAENRRYVELYERHAAVLGLLEQMGTFPAFQALRRDLRVRVVERAELVIRALQDDGQAAVEPLDPHVVANALVGMLDRFVYTWFVLGEPFDKESTLETLDGIWLRTLGITDTATPTSATGPGARAPR